MRDWKTSLIYRLLSRHQNDIIVCIYVFGSFLKNRIIAYENYQRAHYQKLKTLIQMESKVATLESNNMLIDRISLLT